MQITLRRLRHVIESKAVGTEHLVMLQALSQSEIPPDLIQGIFGHQYSSLYSVKVLLQQAIQLYRTTDDVKMNNFPSETSLNNDSISETNERPTSVFRRVSSQLQNNDTNRVTTPQPLLDMLESVEKQARKKAKKKSKSNLKSVMDNMVVLTVSGAKKKEKMVTFPLDIHTVEPIAKAPQNKSRK
ncbi:hypothetical protein BC833DRAFT_445765 [Globomyces pollinis-pini]|nr:hypothetical protein BC833DRAFT_445765 [Globomyces pollinis-pini]